MRPRIGASVKQSPLLTLGFVFIKRARVINHTIFGNIENTRCQRGDEVAFQSVRNLPNVHVLVADQLNTYDVLCADDIVFTHAALEAFVGSPVKADAVSVVEDVVENVGENIAEHKEDDQ